MNKIKIIFICLLILFFVLTVFALFKIKHNEDFQQKTLLALETRKVLDHLMIDLSEARESTILNAPPDGLWHHRIAFSQARQGPLEYLIKEGHLFRAHKGEMLLIADHIKDMRIRRQKETPDLVEVQIEAQNSVLLESNLKMRIQP